MDTSTWMRNQGANCTVGEPAMESGDWMAQPQRQRSVNKIMDNLKRHLPFSGYEPLQELKKIAEKVEEEIYTACQSEYKRKICFMMTTMETRLQNRIQSNSAVLDNSIKPSAVIDLTANGGDWQEEVYQKIDAMKDLFLLESTAQTENPDVHDGQEEVYQMIEAIKDLYRIESTAQTVSPKGEDWQEEMYLKIKVMKDLYLLDLRDAYQKVLSKLQQHDYFPPQLKNEQPERLKLYKDKLERLMQFLQMPKHEILASYKDKLGIYEKHIIRIINLINGNRPILSAQQRRTQAQANSQRLATADGFQKQNVMDMQKRLCPQKRAVPEPSSNLTAQTDNPNGEDWREEAYQKIKSMKDLYLPELKVIHLKILSKLQQYDSLPQQPKNEFHVQLKVVKTKTMLERLMCFLQIPKHGMLRNSKDRAVSYEKEIIHFINACRQSRSRPQNTSDYVTKISLKNEDADYDY